MILLEDKTENGWVKFTYQSTWRLYYEIMLNAAEEVIELDFKDNLGRLAVFNPGSETIECLEDYKLYGRSLRRIPAMKEEHGAIIVSGYSSIMECNIQLTFYNQTNVVTLHTNKLDYVEKYSRDVFTNYVNSIEIKIYVRDTKNSMNSAKSEPRIDEKYIKSLPFMKKLKLLFG